MKGKITMKNYLSLSNLSESVTRIVPSFRSTASKKATKVSKEMAFVVFNSDDDYGMYMRRLGKEISRLNLNEMPKILRKKSLKNIETGNIIVFGDASGNIDYDYRVETDHTKLSHLDGRKFKVYDLIVDFEKVIKRLKKFANENEESYLLVKDEDSEVNVTEININLNLHKKRPLSVTPIAIIRQELTEDKVTIFDNWVKIGYNQYDIYTDLFTGKEWIYVSGNKFFVKEDKFGRKYLTK